MRNKKLLIVAVLLGAAVVLLINVQFSALKAEANYPKTAFYRAQVDILPESGLTLAMAVESTGVLKKIAEVPESMAKSWPDAIDEKEYERWKDSEIARTVKAGSFLTMLDLRPFATKEMSERFDAGEDAISIAVGPENAVAYLLAPGDEVDVFLTRMVGDSAAGGGQRAQVELIAESVKVFAVGHLLQPTPGERNAMKYRGESYSTVTVVGTPAVVKTLLKGKAEGILTFALRSSKKE